MEGNCTYERFDFQDSVRDLHLRAMNQNQNQNISGEDSSFSFAIVAPQTCVHKLTTSEYNNGERGKNLLSEEDEPCLSRNGQNKSKKNSPWHRVKWVDKMVKLMITALSYIGGDSGLDNGNGNRLAVLQKKGKWRSVSKAMDERGYHVSPQQCEDKFNDLNKRYKKLNEMIGRGICCEVVENPALLDKIDYLNEKEKEQVRKIMSSKHLFYEEMCSYHNGNRLHLPHDPALQRSLHLMMLRSSDDHDNEDDLNDYEEMHLSRDSGGPLKRLRQSQSPEDDVHPNKSYVCNLPLSQAVVSIGTPLDNGKAAKLQMQQIEYKSLELEEGKFQIQAELMELERQRLKWERFCEKRDQKLEKMRLGNERMKLENQRMSLELERIKMGVKL